MWTMRAAAPTRTVDDIDGRVVERQAVEAARAGDCGAFAVLVETHQRRVRAMMLRLVNNAADADDLAQSAFVAAFVALDAFDVEPRFSTWVYRIAINLAKDHLKSKKRGERALDDHDVENAAFAGRIAAADEATLAHQRQVL